MTESDFWLQVKANVPGHLIRIENLAGVGTPDVNACHNGIECWLELKVAKGHQIYFRAAQVVFMTRRVAEKGRVDRKSSRLNPVTATSRMPSSA